MISQSIPFCSPRKPIPAKRKPIFSHMNCEDVCACVVSTTILRLFSETNFIICATKTVAEPRGLSGYETHLPISKYPPFLTSAACDKIFPDDEQRTHENICLFCHCL